MRRKRLKPNVEIMVLNEFDTITKLSPEEVCCISHTYDGYSVAVIGPKSAAFQHWVENQGEDIDSAGAPRSETLDGRVRGLHWSIEYGIRVILKNPYQVMTLKAFDDLDNNQMEKGY